MPITSYNKSMTTNTMENTMTTQQAMSKVRQARTIITETIQDLKGIGCTDIKKEGPCWSFTTQDGKRFAGGIAATHQFIMNGFPSTKRETVRLSCDANGKTWTEENGG
jgi:hypothetical protein